ncbi:hypothetical protein [Deinococcus sp. QL22]|uniref:hypothetical protein n=1 Tax=Deinococcus sp. QL22 TaxID=2939437 RepID=UPI0020174645|nr:hypothetical protein [Deinococcus sp. QL22]UQN06521.1 hypothetical protein M1R55_00965 [Deinococcus sp. QL22]
MTAVLRSVLESEENITVQQYAALCVGPYMNDRELHEVVQALLLTSEDLRWKVMDAIREQQHLSPEVQRMLDDVRQSTTDGSLSSDIADALQHGSRPTE